MFKNLLTLLLVAVLCTCVSAQKRILKVDVIDTDGVKLEGLAKTAADITVAGDSTKLVTAKAVKDALSALAVGGVDSTRLLTDSILVYFQADVEVGRDTLRGLGAGAPAYDDTALQAQVDALPTVSFLRAVTSDSVSLERTARIAADEAAQAAAENYTDAQLLNLAAGIATDLSNSSISDRDYTDAREVAIRADFPVGEGTGITEAQAKSIASDSVSLERLARIEAINSIPKNGVLIDTQTVAGYVSGDVVKVSTTGIMYRAVSSATFPFNVNDAAWVPVDTKLTTGEVAAIVAQEGYIVSKNYDATGSKGLKRKIDANEKISMGALGDSKTQGGQRGPNRLRSLVQNEIGFSGYGYVVLDGGSAPGMNIVNVGGTVHDGGATFGAYSLSGYAVELNTGNSYGYSIPTTPSVVSFNDRVTLFYLAQPGAGTANVTYGSTTVSINASNGTLEKRSVTISGTYGPNAFLVDNVVGGLTLTDVVFHADSQTSGVWFHVIGNGGYTSSALKSRFTQPLNRVVLDTLRMDYGVLRLGTNDWAADLAPGQVGFNYDTILNKLREVNPNIEFTITGLEDANLTAPADYTRGEYEAVQSSKAVEYGANFAPMTALIPTWTRWDSLGYADDNVHSNAAGGNLIGDYLYGIMKGDIVHNGKSLGSGNLEGLPPNAVVVSDASGNSTANTNKLFWSSTLDRMGIMNPNPEYTLDLPISSTNSWRLTGLRMTPSGGLVWDNTASTGLEGNVLFDVSPNNSFQINLAGGSSLFAINGNTNVQLSDYLNISATGTFTYDNTTAEGDVNWLVDAGNDYNIKLGGGGSAEFKIFWNTSDLLGSWQYNQLLMDVNINMAGTKRVRNMAAPAADGDAVRRIDLDNAIAALPAGPSPDGDSLWNHIVTEDIDFKGFKATDLGTPTDHHDAARLREVRGEGGSSVTDVIVTATSLRLDYALVSTSAATDAVTLTVPPPTATRQGQRISVFSAIEPGGTHVTEIASTGTDIRVGENVETDVVIPFGSKYVVECRLVDHSGTYQWVLDTGDSEKEKSGRVPSMTTNAAGDVVLTHNLGVIPNYTGIQTYGDTFVHAQVRAESSTTTTIRFFDSSGALLANTAVSYFWTVKL
jgi:lysophospholipase L1-like esterase